MNHFTCLGFFGNNINEYKIKANQKALRKVERKLEKMKMKLEQVEDREVENEKQHQKIEESTKRKMGVDEARVEQMKERARNFI